MDFSRRSDHPLNAALNYGYSILLSAFNREIAACGYVTQLGLHHDNVFNQFNLSSDLMEPFRILVDRAVYQYDMQELGTENKRKLANVLNGQITIGGTRQTVMAAVGIYVRSVFEALSEKDPGRIKFYEV